MLNRRLASGEGIAEGPMNWKVISKYERSMVLERGSERKELTCPTNRVGTAIFGALRPGQPVEEVTIRLFLTDFKSDTRPRN